jgi:TrpR family trp operon transcriptional repressor
MMTPQEAYELCLKRLCAIEDPKEMQWFLDILLTNAERDDIADRIRLCSYLAGGQMSQRQIAQSLDLSITKVTRGASNLKEPKTQAYFQTHFPVMKESS